MNKKEGKARNSRRSASDIQITALPELKVARPWYAQIDSTVLQQNVKRNVEIAATSTNQIEMLKSSSGLNVAITSTPILALLKLSDIEP